MTKNKKKKTTTVAEGIPPGPGGQFDILAIIAARNEQEAKTGTLIKDFETKIVDFFHYVRGSSEGERLIIKMKSHVSENEIYKMIHRNSSSVVKWIMIIGILEFLFLTGLGFYFADDSYTKSLEKFHIDTLMTILTFVNYAVCIGFIFHFYKN